MIRKAVIPIAGRGARMLPLSAAVPKALLPLVDPAGRVLPALHVILLEAASAGVEAAVGIVSTDERERVQRYLSAAAEAFEERLPTLEFIEQPEPVGLGDAVARAASFVGNEPFAVMLGDHVHVASAGGESCLAQLTSAYQRHGGAAMVGMQVVAAEESPLVGVARGEPVDDQERLYRCRELVEKPTAAVAEGLGTPGIRGGQCLAHNGHYIFTAEIFDCLAESAAAGGEGELGLTEAQSLLLARHPDDYYLLVVAGGAYDVGHPAGYAAALAALRAG